MKIDSGKSGTVVQIMHSNLQTCFISYTILPQEITPVYGNTGVILLKDGIAMSTMQSTD